MIENYNIYAVELPGHFETPVNDPKDLSPKRYGELCISLIQTLKLDNLIVIGHSMGGGIAMQIAAKLPLLVKKLVLVSPANSRCANLSTLRQVLFNFSPTTPAKVRKFYQQLVYEKNLDLFARTLGRDAIQNFTDRAKEYKILRKRMASLGNLRNMQFNEKHIQCQTLLIVGAHDHTINGESTIKHLTKMIPHLTVKSFEKSGHFAYLEEPILFNEVVNDFLIRKLA